jgi:hypothetical protein
VNNANQRSSFEENTEEVPVEVMFERTFMLKEFSGIVS